MGEKHIKQIVIESLVDKYFKGQFDDLTFLYLVIQVIFRHKNHD